MRRTSNQFVDVAILVTALAGYLLVFGLTNLTWAELFWDFDVYLRAVTDAVVGANPYRRDAGFPFVYHPVVLYAFMLLDGVVGLAAAFIGLCAGAVLIFLWGYKNIPLRRFRTSPPANASPGDKAILLLVIFSAANLSSILSGNITFYLHLAFIGSTLAYLQQRSAGRQFLMLGIFSSALLVKPYFLVYALPLVMVDRFSLRSIARVAVSMLASAAVYLLFWVFFRQHTMLFIDAINFMAFGGDLSDSSLGLLLRMLPVEQALKVHLVFAAAFAVLVVFLRRASAASGDGRDDDSMLFLLAYVLMTLCSPRMKDYDLTPAFICFYLYLSCSGMFGRWIILLSLMLIQLPLWVILYLGRMNTPEIFTALQLWHMIGLVLPLAIFLCERAWSARSNKQLRIAT